MFCRKCGKEMPDDSVFCGACGANQGGGIAVDGNKPSGLDWRDVWERVYERAVDKFENGRDGGRTNVVGGQVTINYSYYSGIEAGTKALGEAIDKIIPIIKKIANENEDELKEVLETVKKDVDSLINKISDKISSEHTRMRHEIGVYWDNAEGFSSSMRRMPEKNNDIEAEYKAELEAIEKSFLGEFYEIKDQMISKYWVKHNDEKMKLESEKELLEKQIAEFHVEIANTPQNTEGYSRMLECKKKITDLTAQKNKLGVFKGKEKKALQVQIDELAKESNSIQSRIDSAIKAVKDRIESSQSRITAIEEEIENPAALE